MVRSKLFIPCVLVVGISLLGQQASGMAYVQKVIINGGTAYAAIALTTLCHELGHALTAKMLTGKMPSIYLGAPSTKNAEKKSPLVLCGVSIKGLNPFLGSTSLAANQTKVKKAAIAFAGPLAGVSACLLGGAYAGQKNVLLGSLFALLACYNLTQLVPAAGTDGACIAKALA